MIPTQGTMNAINNSLAVNTGLWGSTVPIVQLTLIKNSFVPNPGILAGDLTPATFDGSDPIPIPIQPQVLVLDNLTGRIGVVLKEPVGGYRWTCLSDGPAEVIYGYAVMSLENDFCYWSDVLPVPITIENTGNFVELSAVLAYMVNIPYGNLPAV